MDLLSALRRLIHATAPIPAVGGKVALTVFRMPPPRTLPLSDAHELTWESRETTSIPFGRHPLAVHRWATPKARGRVLLAHGWSMNTRVWMSWIEPLQRAGLEPIGLDFPAHGASSGRLADPELFGRALGAVMAQGGPFDAAVGHSAGGATLASGLARVVEDLAPKRVAMLGVPASAEALFDYFQRKLDLSVSAREVAERAFARRFGPEIWERSAGADLARGSADVLLAHDSEDASVPQHNLERILAEGGAAAADWTVLRTDGLGHQGIVQDPEVIDQVVAFLGQG